MNEDRAAAGDVLVRVIERAGRDVVRDRPRTIGLLRDGARNRYRPLIDMLVRTLNYGIPEALLRAHEDGRPIDAIERDAVARLAEETLSDRDAAAWAVGAWRGALGITQ